MLLLLLLLLLEEEGGLLLLLSALLLCLFFLLCFLFAKCGDTMQLQPFLVPCQLLYTQLKQPLLITRHQQPTATMAAVEMMLQANSGHVVGALGSDDGLVG